jgi:DNA-binding LacI/PurR family transcriptional regulator
MSITLREVAKAAGVSVATVSRVINNDKYVSKKAKKKVLGAIKKTNYRPNLIARGLKKSKTGTIGIFMPEILNPYGGAIVNTMEHYSYKKGYSSILCITENNSEKEKNHIEILKGKLIDGYVIVPSSNKNNYYKKIFENENVVSVDSCMGIPHEICVKSDNFMGIKLAIDYLLSLGHTRIGVINISLGLKTGYERYNAFKKICIKEKIALDERFIKFTETGKDPVPGLEMIERAREKAHELMEQKERPTAIISTGIYVTIGALRAFNKMGTRIPDDISFISFDELYEYSDLFKTEITTIRQPAGEIGKLAMELLLKKIEGQAPDPGIIEMEPQLIIADSCKKMN